MELYSRYIMGARGNKMPVTQAHFNAYLNVLVVCMVQDGFISQLKGTPFYRQSMAMHGNQLLGHIRRFMDESMDQVASADMETMTVMIERFGELIELIREMKADDIGNIAAIIAEYKRNPKHMENLILAHMKCRPHENVP